MGTMDSFTYQRCSNCMSVQITEIPQNLHDYYSGDYYSFKTHERTFLRHYLKRRHELYSSGQGSALGFLISRIIGTDALHNWLVTTNTNPNSRILDVGCGAGNLLKRLAQIGYRNLTGIDPFLDDAHCSSANPRILNSTLEEQDEEYDLIMFHHSLEHVPDPEATLLNAKRLLAPKGRILVRVPISASYSHVKYGTDWVQLDAPRHISIPSNAGFQLLALRLKLSLIRMEFDSHSLQFIGSELYRKNLSLDENLPRYKELFSKAQISGFKKKSAHLNEICDGDSCCYILEKFHDEPGSSSPARNA